MSNQEKVGRICCPSCGNDDPLKIRYIEKIECYRQVLGVSSEGELRINGLYMSGEGYDDGEDPRFECHADIETRGNHCLYQWPVPEWVRKKIDWV